jgi:hypothetical protein
MQATEVPTRTGEDKDSRHDPCLQYHADDKHAVEYTPRVLEHVSLFIEGEKADEDLCGEKNAKEVLENLEHRLGLGQHSRLVIVCVHSDPKRIYTYHAK